MVVGAGAAGGWVAKELCEQGLSVLLLDAGAALDPDSDFPTGVSEARLRARLAALLGGQHVQMRCPAFSARTQRFFVNDRENPYTTPSGKPFNWFRGRQVGGRLHVWARVSPRLTDAELHAASRDGFGEDWPLTRADLDPHYDRVEAFLGFDSIPPTAHEARFEEIAGGTIPNLRVVRPPILRHDAGRLPLTIRAAMETGRLVVRADAVVTRVLIDPTGDRAIGVALVDRRTRQPEQVRAPLVFMCASTIETLRIMLNSVSRLHPNGLANSSGRLGRGLTDHVLAGIGGPLGDGPVVEPSDPYDFGAVTGFQIPRFRNLDRPHAGFLRGYGIQGAIGRGGPSWYLLLHGEMLSRPENRVQLDLRRRDAWGVPAAHIDCAFSPNEEAMAADALAVMHELAHAAGLRVRTPPSGRRLEAVAFRLWKRRLVSRSGAFHPGSAAHELGGAPMGVHPKTSVLNRFGQCWDVPNVIVADGAAFPSACWQNTTLTIMALAVRASEHALREYRAGRL